MRVGRIAAGGTGSAKGGHRASPVKAVEGRRTRAACGRCTGRRAFRRRPTIAVPCAVGGADGWGAADGSGEHQRQRRGVSLEPALRRASGRHGTNRTRRWSAGGRRNDKAGRRADRRVRNYRGDSAWWATARPARAGGTPARQACGRRVGSPAPSAAARLCAMEILASPSEQETSGGRLDGLAGGLPSSHTCPTDEHKTSSPRSNEVTRPPFREALRPKSTRDNSSRNGRVPRTEAVTPRHQALAPTMTTSTSTASAKPPMTNSERPAQEKEDENSES